MRFSYATILSSEEFVTGVKALFKGVRAYSEKDFTVFTDEVISDGICEELEKLGMKVIKEHSPVFPENVISKKQALDRWNKTLFKLVIFKNHGFDKLVYLDSDLLIRGSLDSLFEKPEWSAVSDRDFFPECSRGGLNAGVMVIKPSEETFCKLLSEVEKVASEQEIFGDQDVINSFLKNWEDKKELHLDKIYNACFYSDCISKDSLAVHFIFENKPWMWSKSQILLKSIKWFLVGKQKRNVLLSEYKDLFKE